MNITMKNQNDSAIYLQGIHNEKPTINNILEMDNNDFVMISSGTVNLCKMIIQGIPMN